MKIYKLLFGKKLKAARKKAGISQEELAALVGVEGPSVSRWETGKDFPEDSRLKKIESAIGVDESYFLESESKSPGLEELSSFLVKQKLEIESLQASLSKN